MNAQFQFRLNGLIITHMKVRRVVVAGATDHSELVACHDTLGEFAIDDNEGLTDPALSRFVLEVRDVNIPPIERRYLPNKGWKRITTRECLALLESSGVIECLRTTPASYDESQCSACDHIFAYRAEDTVGETTYDDPKFCPNCGTHTGAEEG